VARLFLRVSVHGVANRRTRRWRVRYKCGSIVRGLCLRVHTMETDMDALTDLVPSEQFYCSTGAVEEQQAMPLLRANRLTVEPPAAHPHRSVPPLISLPVLVAFASSGLTLGPRARPRSDLAHHGRAGAPPSCLIHELDLTVHHGDHILVRFSLFLVACMCTTTLAFAHLAPLTGARSAAAGLSDAHFLCYLITLCRSRARTAPARARCSARSPVSGSLRRWPQLDAAVVPPLPPPAPPHSRCHRCSWRPPWLAVGVPETQPPHSLCHRCAHSGLLSSPQS
jgi:hypothetical protein